MRIIVRSKESNLWLPIPLSLVGAAIRLMPESAVAEMRKSLPPSVQEAFTKQFLRELFYECRSLLREYKGLEIVHVEAQDGTFVSIRI